MCIIVSRVSGWLREKSKHQSPFFQPVGFHFPAATRSRYPFYSYFIPRQRKNGAKKKKNTKRVSRLVLPVLSPRQQLSSFHEIARITSFLSPFTLYNTLYTMLVLVINCYLVDTLYRYINYTIVLRKLLLKKFVARN